MKTKQLHSVSAIFLAGMIFLAVGCQQKAEKAELEKFKAAAQIQEQNKLIVREFFAAVDKNDFDKLDGLLSSDFTLNGAGLTQPWKKDDVYKDIKRYYTSFPDWKHVIEEMTAEGDKVAVKLIQQGTHKALFEEIAPTGTRVSKTAMHLVTIVNGKVKEWWAIEDDLGLMLQLGMELKPKK